MHRWLSAFGLLIILAAACAPDSSATPEAAVLPYLEALLTGDADAVYKSVCPQWEAGAQRDLDAFSGVTGTLHDARCVHSGTAGEFTLVTCTGTMQIDYNGELRDRSLAGTTYRVQRIGGDWKLCGYN